MELSFDRALQIALERNESLKAGYEAVRAGEGRVAEARAAFLPSADLSFQYTPAQQFPVIRIPAGIFGPEEQRFQAAFTRQNIMQLNLDPAALHRRAPAELLMRRRRRRPRRAACRSNVPGRK